MFEVLGVAIVGLTVIICFCIYFGVTIGYGKYKLELTPPVKEPSRKKEKKIDYTELLEEIRDELKISKGN